MNFYLKPHPIMAHWAPGFLVLATVLLRHYEWSYQRFMEYMPSSQAKSVLVGVTIAAAAWMVGQALDALRDLLEYVMDSLWKVQWDFFFWAGPEEIENFQEHYYTYYIFCANMAIGLAWLLSLLLTRGGCNTKVLASGLALFAFFCADALLLRGEIKRVLDDWNRRPHRGNGKAH